MSSNSNTVNAGTEIETIQVSLTDVNAVRGTHTFGTQSISWTNQIKVEGIVSGMYSADATGFYTSRNNIKILDVLSEGEIEGLVSGEYNLVGRLGHIGYDSYTVDPVAPTHPEDWLKSIYLNETPVVGEGHLYNYQQVAVAHTNGEPGGIKDTDDFLAINDTDGIQRARVISERLRGPDPSGTHPSYIYHPKVYFVANPQVDKIKINIKIPALKYVKLGSEFTAAEQGFEVGTKLSFKTRYRAKRLDGSTSPWLPDAQGTTQEVEGLMSNPYMHPVTIPLPSAQMTDELKGWEVEMTRLTLDSIEGHITNQTYVASIVEVFSSKFSFPNSAMVAMEFDAEYFTQIPTRAYDARLLKVKVPVGYDPILRTYPANWDGKWQGEEVNTERQWTDNPAWIFYDLLSNRRYGLGKYIDQLSIDKWTLLKIAEYCDTLVDDGNDGLEPRFSANVLINSREEAEKVLKDFASIFRSMTYFGLGNIHAVQDAPRSPVGQFLNASVEDGNFTYASSAKKSRSTVISVRYNDKTNFYKPAIEYVEDAQGIKKYGFLEKEITAFGCTSRTQAIRLARWILYTEAYETEMVNFKCGLEGSILRPGDLIKVIDENRSETKDGGRLINVTETGILLDKNLHIGNVDKNYLLTLNTPTYYYDTSITDVTHASHIDDIRRSQLQTIEFNPSTSDIIIDHYPVVSGVSGDANPIMGTEINFNSSLWTFDDINYNLRSGDITWSIQDTDYGENYYSIISIKEDHSFKYSVEGLQHTKEKYLAIESGITFTPSDPFDPTSSAPPPAPKELKLDLETAKDSSGNNTNTKLIKYTITKADVPGTTNSFLVYVKEGSTWSSEDMQKKADGTATTIPKEKFLEGSLSVTVNPGQELSSYYFPHYNDTRYYFRVFSQNAIGILSAGKEDDSEEVTGHFPIRDIKIHSLRLAGDTSENPSGDKSSFGLASGKDYVFTWDISYANSYITGYPLKYIIYVTKTSGTSSPPVVSSSTLIRQETVSNNTYLFSFDMNKDSPLNGSPFRTFDFVVEAIESEGSNTSSLGFTNSNGYDMYYLDNPRPQDYNLTPRTLDRTRPGPIASNEMMTTEQFVTSDGKLELKIRQSLYNDLAGGMMYLSAQPFDNTDFDIYGRPDNAKRIAELNAEELQRSGQFVILECPFDFDTETFSAGSAVTIPGNIEGADDTFNYTQTYYMAARFIDSFDKARRDANVSYWDRTVPIAFARYATVDGTDGTARNVNGIPCGLCSGDQAVAVYPYQYTSANSDNPYFAWIRMNVNGQWEGNGIAAVKMMTKGDVDAHYGYKGFYDYSCDMISVHFPGMGWKPNDDGAYTMCRFTQGKIINYGSSNPYISNIGGANVVHNPATNNYTTGLYIGVPKASLYTDESIPSINALGETIANRSRPLLGFRRFRVYFDPKRLPAPHAENGLASYSIVGQNAWNGAYETFDTHDPDNLILGSETISASTFGVTVQHWLKAGANFENLPGIWNHHSAGFAAGFGGLKKNQYYFDVHLGRMIDHSYLNEAFFGVLSANDYSILSQYADHPASASNDLTIAQYDGNTFVTETY